MKNNGSYFKGWSSLGPKTKAPKSIYGDSNVEVVIGQVLDVFYNIPADVEATAGLIRVKISKVNSSKSDDSILALAFPADQSVIKYPLPGELVFLTPGPRDYQSEGYVSKIYYYTTVLTASKSISYNSNPYFFKYERETETGIGNLLQAIFRGQSVEKRYEVKLVDVSRFIKKDVVLDKPALKPYEGDFIIQSRFGSSIRLGSTVLGADNPWSTFGGKAGSPMTIFSIRNTVLETTAEATPPSSRFSIEDAGNILDSIANFSKLKSIKTVVEDVNNDAATIAFFSKQQVDVKLAVSRKLKSFGYAYNVKETGFTQQDTSDPVSFLPSPIQPFKYGNLNLAKGGEGSGGGGSFGSSANNDPDELERLYDVNSIEPATIPHIAIGDSQTPYVVRGSKKVQLLGSAGQKNLHKGGQACKWLVTAVTTRQVSPQVKTVVVCIGTNGGFNTKDPIKALYSELKTKFPNARFLAIMGSWNWGGNKNITEKQVRDYYKLHQDQGATLVEPPIGPYEPHSFKNDGDTYNKIGAALDRLIT